MLAIAKCKHTSICGSILRILNLGGDSLVNIDVPKHSTLVYNFEVSVYVMAEMSRQRQRVKCKTSDVEVII